MGHDSSASEPTTDLANADRSLLTVEEAAHRLGIGRTTMYRYVSSGELETVTLGRLRRVPAECLDDFVAGLRATQPVRNDAASNAA